DCARGVAEASARTAAKTARYVRITRDTTITNRSAKASRSFCSLALQPSFVFRFELERDAVHAVPLTCGRRTVVKHVTEMAAALRAVHLGARHAVAAIGHRVDGVLERLVEAGPAGAALEFRLGRKQRLAAAGAFERAGAFLFI